MPRVAALAFVTAAFGCHPGPEDLGPEEDRARVEARVAPALGDPDPAPAVLGRPVAAGPWTLSTRFLSFSTVRPGCGTRLRTVELFNDSEGPRRIDIFGVDAPFLLHPSTPATFEVAADRSVRLELFFPSVGPGAYRGRLALGLQDAGRLEVELSADIVPGHEVRDRVMVPERRVRDELIVINDAELMGDSLAALEANLRAYFQFQLAWGADVRLGFTTGRYGPDGGGGVLIAPDDGGPRWLRPDEPERLMKFLSNLLTLRPGPSSALFRSAGEVFESASFLREGSEVQLIFVSALDDASEGSIDAWLDDFRALRGFRQRSSFSIAAISGGSSRCSGPGGTAQASPRLLHAAEATGGVFQSVCTADWSRSLEDLSTHAYLSKFSLRLSSVPRPETLAAFVDGREVLRKGRGGTVHWTFDPASNAVVFAPYAHPEPGAELELRYFTSCR